MENERLPADPGAEMALVGSLMIAPEFIEDAITKVSANDFTDGRCAIMFMTILHLHRIAGTRIDAVQIHSQLQSTGKLEMAGGYEFLKEILGCVPGAVHWDRYAAIVRTLSIARQGISEAHRLASALYTDPTTAHESLNASQTNLASLAVDVNGGGQLIRDILPQVLQSFLGSDEQKTEGDVWTHFQSIDNIMGPAHPGNMIAICGHTAHGKSTLGGAIGCNNARLGVPGAIVTFEMTKKEYAARILSNYSGMTEWQIKNASKAGSRATAQQEADFTEAMRIINEDATLIIDDDCRPKVTDVRARLRNYIRQHEIKWCVIDNYQLMGGTGGERYQQMVDVSRELKRMAMDLGIVVYLLCQLHARCLNEDRRPGLYDIEDCKKPSKDADTVILIDWEGHRKRSDAAWIASNTNDLHKVWVNLPKIRGKASGETFLRIDPKIYSFYDWQTEPAQQTMF